MHTWSLAKVPQIVPVPKLMLTVAIEESGALFRSSLSTGLLNSQPVCDSAGSYLFYFSQPLDLHRKEGTTTFEDPVSISILKLCGGSPIVMFA